jgi:AraC-like DNA-binding protein
MVTASRSGSQTFSSQLVPLLLGYARGHGADVDELVRRFELPADAEVRPEIDIEVGKLNALFDTLADATSDPFLGVHVAEGFRRGTYQLLEFCCRNAPDLRGAIKRVVRFSSLLNRAATFSFTETKEAGALEHHHRGMGRHGNEFAIATLYLLGRGVSGRIWSPDAVWFAHERPRDIAPLTDLFGTERITFGRPSNGLALDARVLDAPLVAADQALLRVLDAEVERRAPPPESAADHLSSDVERAVEVALELGAPRIESVASALGTSVRTLQRRLGEEGVSFQAVVEQTRERLARSHAQNGKLTSAQIAFLLGYADVTSFLRAFKRWTGTTPQTYRGARRARAPE